MAAWRCNFGKPRTHHAAEGPDIAEGSLDAMTKYDDKDSVRDNNGAIEIAGMYGWCLGVCVCVCL